MTVPNLQVLKPAHLAQATAAYTGNPTELVEIETFRGQVPTVTAFGSPESVKGIDPLFPAI
ncbi:MAG: hypothetical protein ACRC2U_05645 [Aeromonas sp.]